MSVMLTPAEVTSALDTPERIAAVERLKSRPIPTDRIEAVLVELAETLGDDPFCAATYLDARDQVFLATSDGPTETVRREISHCQYVIATGSWLCLNDASIAVGPMLKLRRAILRGEPIAAYLGFRLTFDDQIVGAVCAADTHKRIWTQAEHFLVYQASIAIRDLLAA